MSLTRARSLHLALALVVVSTALAGCLEGILDDPLLGKAAPAFSVTTIDGKPVNLTDHEGRFLILDLMATWCGPCRLEIPHLKEIQGAYGKEAVTILSVGADRQEDAERLREFKFDVASDWDYAPDPTGKVAQAYGVRVLPKMIIIDPNGTVVFAQQGEVYPSTMARVLGPSKRPVADGDEGVDAEAPTRGSAKLALPVAASMAAGAAVALTPWMQARRAQWRVHPARGPALALLALAGVALATLAYFGQAFLSGRLTYGGLAGAAVLVLGAAYASTPRARRKTEAMAWPPEASTRSLVARAVGDWSYYALPYALVPVTFALSGIGLLAFVAPFAAFVTATVAGVALVLHPKVGTWRHLDTAGVTSSILVGLLLVARWGGMLS